MLNSSIRVASRYFMMGVYFYNTGMAGAVWGNWDFQEEFGVADAI